MIWGAPLKERNVLGERIFLSQLGCIRPSNASLLMPVRLAEPRLRLIALREPYGYQQQSAQRSAGIQVMRL